MKRVNHYSSPLATTLFSRVSSGRSLTYIQLTSKRMYFRFVTTQGKIEGEKKESAPAAAFFLPCPLQRLQVPGRGGVRASKDVPRTAVPARVPQYVHVAFSCSLSEPRKRPWGEGATQVTVRRENN